MRRSRGGGQGVWTPPPPEKSQKDRASQQYWSGSPQITTLSSQHSMFGLHPGPDVVLDYIDS